jgi:hypothetical protein
MKRAAAGAPPIDGAKRKPVGLSDSKFLILGEFFVTLPDGVKVGEIALIAHNGDEPWVEWHKTPAGMVGTVSTRKLDKCG